MDDSTTSTAQQARAAARRSPPARVVQKSKNVASRGNGAVSPADEAPGTLEEALVLISHLQHAVATNRVVGAAVGILMERHCATYDQAYAQLRATSNDLNHKLALVARHVVDAVEERAPRVQAVDEGREP